MVAHVSALHYLLETQYARGLVERVASIHSRSLRSAVGLYGAPSWTNQMVGEHCCCFDPINVCGPSDSHTVAQSETLSRRRRSQSLAHVRADPASGNDRCCINSGRSRL